MIFDKDFSTYLENSFNVLYSEETEKLNKKLSICKFTGNDITFKSNEECCLKVIFNGGIYSVEITIKYTDLLFEPRRYIVYTLSDFKNQDMTMVAKNAREYEKKIGKDRKIVDRNCSLFKNITYRALRNYVIHGGI